MHQRHRCSARLHQDKPLEVRIATPSAINSYRMRQKSRREPGSRQGSVHRAELPWAYESARTPNQVSASCRRTACPPAVCELAHASGLKATAMTERRARFIDSKDLHKADVFIQSGLRKAQNVRHIAESVLGALRIAPPHQSPRPWTCLRRWHIQLTCAR